MSIQSSSFKRPNITSNFEVNVAKQNFKFHCAHFVAFKGFRERLHGHNYQVGVRLLGSRKIYSDGYVLDYGDVKKSTRRICKELNEHFICPILSDVLKITLLDEGINGGSVQIDCEDGTRFLFPRNDCVMLPIMHATTEELAIYVWGKLLHELGNEFLLKRGIHTMEVTISEATGQEATFRMHIPDDMEDKAVFSVENYIVNEGLTPTGCPNVEGEWNKKNNVKTNEDKCCANCGASDFHKQLEALAKAINDDELPKPVTVMDLKAFFQEK